MLENATTPQTRTALENAHQMRGQALRAFFGWLRGN